MVAWNGSREATRAVNDSLPFLQKAEEVEVMAINPHGGPHGHGDVPGADIALHLARHDVQANAEHVFSDDIDPGSMLLSRITDENIDLLVMGAYGALAVPRAGAWWRDASHPAPHDRASADVALGALFLQGRRAPCKAAVSFHVRAVPKGAALRLWVYLGRVCLAPVTKPT